MFQSVSLAFENTSVLIDVLSTKCSNVPLYIYIETYIFVYVQFILSVYQEIALIFMLFSFLFAIPTIAYRQVGQH